MRTPSNYKIFLSSIQELKPTLVEFKIIFISFNLIKYFLSKIIILFFFVLLVFLKKFELF